MTPVRSFFCLISCSLSLGEGRGEVSPLIISPEATGKEHQHRHDFQTSNEHQERAEPLDMFGQFAPRHLGANLCAKGWTDIADAAQGNGDGIGIIDIGGYHQCCREQYHQCEDGKESQQGAQLGAWNGDAVDLDGEDGIRVQQLMKFVA